MFDLSHLINTGQEVQVANTTKLVSTLLLSTTTGHDLQTNLLRFYYLRFNYK